MRARVRRSRSNESLPVRVSPHQFAAFAHVVREGSFSAAAVKLGVTQSAVTQHMGKLETAVGSKLLTRGTDGVALTSTGRELYELADRYATLDQLIEEKLDRYANLDAGHLRIIANAPLPALRLIAEYAARYPEVEIDFTLFDWTSAMGLLREGQVDVAIITAASTSNNWVSGTICETRYVSYMRCGDDLANSKQVSLADVALRRLLLPERGSLTQRVVTKAFQTAGLQMGRVVKTTTFPVMKEAILQGVGVGIFLENSTAEDSLLVSRPITEMTEQYRTSWVVPRDKRNLRLIDSFVSLIHVEA